MASQSQINEAINSVRNLLNQTPPETLAIVYRTSLATTMEIVRNPKLKAKAKEEIDIIDLMAKDNAYNDIASEFRDKVVKMIDHLKAQPDQSILKGYLNDISTGILRVAKGDGGN